MVGSTVVLPSRSVVLPSVVVEAPLVVVEPPLVVVEPPLVVVEPPLVVVDPALVSAEESSSAQPNIASPATKVSPSMLAAVPVVPRDWSPQNGQRDS